MLLKEDYTEWQEQFRKHLVDPNIEIKDGKYLTVEKGGMVYLDGTRVWISSEARKNVALVESIIMRYSENDWMFRMGGKFVLPLTDEEAYFLSLLVCLLVIHKVRHSLTRLLLSSDLFCDPRFVETTQRIDAHVKREFPTVYLTAVPNDFLQKQSLLPVYYFLAARGFRPWNYPQMWMWECLFCLSCILPVVWCLISIFNPQSMVLLGVIFLVVFLLLLAIAIPLTLKQMARQRDREKRELRAIRELINRRRNLYIR